MEGVVGNVSICVHWFLVYFGVEGVVLLKLGTFKYGNIKEID